MKSWGPEMPPKDRAAAAREWHRQHRRQVLMEGLRAQAWALGMGLLEICRISGAVLLVLAIIDVHQADVWVIVLLISTPSLAGLLWTLGAWLLALIRRGPG